VADKNFKVKSGLNIPITSAAILTTDANGNISSTATLPIANGGTGQTSATNAINALLPVQNGSTINYTIQSDGTNVSWAKLYNQLIQNGGVSVTPRRIINFVGATLSDDSGSDTTTITFTDAVGVSKSGGDTITASSASVIPVIVKGAASQSADYFQIQNSGGAVLAQLNTSNQFNVNYGSVYSQGGFRGGVNNHIGFAGLSGFAYSPAYLAIGAQGAVNQTANLQEWRNSSGTVLSAVSPLGQNVIGSSTPLTNSAVQQSITAVTFTSTTATYTYTSTLQVMTIGDYVSISGLDPSGYNGNFQVTAIATVSAGSSYSFTVANTTNATVVDGVGLVALSAGLSITIPDKAHTGIIIKAAANQTASMMEFRTSAGALSTWWDANGAMTASTAVVSTLYSGGFMNTGTLGYFNATTFSSSVIPVVVRGTTSQATDLTQWQNSSGTSLARISNTGIFVGGSFSSDGSQAAGTNIASQFGSTSATRIPLVVYGSASQTANLQEWRNSGGGVLAAILTSGYMLTSGLIDVAGNGAYLATGPSSPITINTRTSSITGLIVKGVSSQSANLQEWQNSSGTVLASINASGNLTVQDLTVNGTTTTINSTTLTVDDKNIELASVASPTDTTADGAGITIKGATDKTFNWVQSTASFTSSEPISAPAFKSAGTAVSSNITLVSGYKYFVDTTSARTLTLPSSPSLGDEIQIFDATGTAFTNNITLSRNGNKINGISDDAIIDINGSKATLTYTGSTYGWRFE
jgi:hypothetical protein